MSELRMFALVVIEGVGVGQKYFLQTDRVLVVGRGSNSDTKIRDPQVSRVHCEVHLDNGVCRVKDLSGGESYINQQCIIDQCVLREQDRLTVGSTTLELAVISELDAPTDSSERTQSAESGEESLGQNDDGLLPPRLTLQKIADLEGHVFLRFQLDELISVGKNSMVFRAVDTKYGRQVAIKILKPQMVSNDTQQQRFIRAMRTTLPIKHPHIVRTRKAGKTGSYCWAAYEWVDGISVAELIESIGVNGALDWKEVWRVAVHISRALQEASRQMIVHRNLTPANLIRRGVDKAYLLTDLIFARALEYTDAPQLTRPGDVIGELGFTAPERIFDTTNVTEKSDQYSLGATLYALLTGEPPHVASSVGELVERFRNEEPVKPSQRGVVIDEDFEAVMMRMLAKSPERRFETIDTLLRRLDEVGARHSIDADWSHWVG